MTDKTFPDDGILWRRWNEAAVQEIRDRAAPVLLFVANNDPLFYARPFLIAVFAAIPKNETLRALLHDRCVPLFLESGEVPWELEAVGAGERYHIAVLSGLLDPLVTIDPVSGDPDKVVREIVTVLERLLASRRERDLGAAP